MSSLAPGVLFKTPGFNQTSTPVGPRATSADIQDRYILEEHTSGEWPSESPVAKVYDVQNSSSRMILLNNKYCARSHLRGQNSDASSMSGSSESSSRDQVYKTPHPNRHYMSPTSDSSRHIECVRSQTPHYEPSVSVPLSDNWINAKTRPPITYKDGSFVNSKHHYSCRVSSNPVYETLEYKKRNQHARPKTLPSSFRGISLEHPDLSKGQKRYLADTAHVYSVMKMKQLNQIRYEHLIYKQKVLGFFSQQDYEKYLTYIQGPKKKLFGGNSSLTYNTRRPRTADPRLESSTPRDSRNGSETGESRSSTGSKKSETYPNPPAASKKPNKHSRRVPIKETDWGHSSEKDKKSMQDDKSPKKSKENKENNQPNNKPTSAVSEESTHPKHSEETLKQDNETIKSSAQEDGEPSQEQKDKNTDNVPDNHKDERPLSPAESDTEHHDVDKIEY